MQAIKKSIDLVLISGTFLLGAMASLSAFAGQDTVIRVGSDDTGCDYASLQSAITAASDGAVILLSGSTDHHRGNIYQVFTKSLTIRGGYASCTATDPSGRTTLDANQQGRVFDIWLPSGADGPQEVILENLEITNGQTSNSGGGILIEGRPGVQSVTLKNVQVTNNQATASGGGVAVLIGGPRDGAGGLILVSDAASMIDSNVSGANGGGLACLNPSGHNIGIGNLMVIDRTNVIGNEAINGGGFSSVNCATTQWYSGGSQFLFLPDSAIAANTASELGGGIYLSDGSALNFRGTSGTASGVLAGDMNAGRIVGNEANHGGGAYVTGASTILRLEEVIVDANSASNDGGGLFVNDGASIEMGRNNVGHSAPCQPQQSASGVITFPRCSRLRGNDAGRHGGAVYIDSGSVLVRHTLISGNGASNFGSVAMVRGSEQRNGQATFSDSLVFGNLGTHLFYAWTNSDLTVRWSTITDNDNPTNALRAFTSTGSARIRLQGSIVQEESGNVLTASGSGTLDVASECVMGHQDPSQVFGSLNRYQQNNPRLFEKDETRPYFPAPTSPAIDFCDGATAGSIDLAARSRGSAHTGSPLTNPPPWSGEGSHDIGAYETNWPELEDEIFTSRFEAN